MRGLDALIALNTRNGLTVAEVAQEIRLPRTTTYRILETLSRAGYVHRNTEDDRYRLTIMVRGLANGFDDEAWITQIARPHMRALCEEVVWPVGIASIYGTEMMIRETTEQQIPLAVERCPPGHRVPLLTSAAGRVHLAFCSQAQRDSLLEILGRSPAGAEELARSGGELPKVLEETRSRGYATAVWPRRVAPQISIAAPILVENRVMAALGIRFSGAAVPLETAVERFLPKLRQTSERIRQAFAEQRQEPGTLAVISA